MTDELNQNHDHDHDHDHNHEYITLIDEEGNEELYEILFTFESEEFDKSYVLVFPAASEEESEVELHAFAYKEEDGGLEGQLYPIETEEEWDMIEEVLNTFVEEEEE
ncbi:MAG TPA: DUF1292 domain-containing protein [Alloiococcus sp.]|nr:DUF1292 domain-containing protein [Alloiococcus sp.]